MNEEEDSLAWHALNYRTASSEHAEFYWQELMRYVVRMLMEDRQNGQEEANRRANMGWDLMCRKMVDAERDRCCRIIFGLCLSDNNAQEIVNKIRSGE
jgi:hypothetical protein